jgi:hypothetical protein
MWDYYRCLHIATDEMDENSQSGQPGRYFNTEPPIQSNSAKQIDQDVQYAKFTGAVMRNFVPVLSYC